VWRSGWCGRCAPPLRGYPPRHTPGPPRHRHSLRQSGVLRTLPPGHAGVPFPTAALRASAPRRHGARCGAPQLECAGSGPAPAIGRGERSRTVDAPASRDVLVIGWLHRCGAPANRLLSVGSNPPAPQGRVPRPGSAGQTLDRPAAGPIPNRRLQRDMAKEPAREGTPPPGRAGKGTGAQRVRPAHTPGRARAGDDYSDWSGARTRRRPEARSCCWSASMSARRTRRTSTAASTTGRTPDPKSTL
jgi:hypothetical protein